MAGCEGAIYPRYTLKEIHPDILAQLQIFDPMAEVVPEAEQGVAKIDHFTMDPSLL